MNIMTDVLVKDKAREDALIVLSKHWIRNPWNNRLVTPVDTILVARDFGCLVYTSHGMRDDTGIVIKKAGEPARIYVNEFLPRASQRAMVAHLFGHVYDREQHMDDEYSYTETRGVCQYHGEAYQFYADLFALHLIMPDEQMRWFTRTARCYPWSWPKHVLVNRIAKRFDVPRRWTAIALALAIRRTRRPAT